MYNLLLSLHIWRNVGITRTQTWSIKNAVVAFMFSVHFDDISVPLQN